MIDSNKCNLRNFVYLEDRIMLVMSHTKHWCEIYYWDVERA